MKTTNRLTVAIERCGNFGRFIKLAILRGYLPIFVSAMVFLVSYPAFSGPCRFQGRQITNLKYHGFRFSRYHSANLSAELYAANPKGLGPYNKEECRNAFITARIFDKIIGTSYRVFQTNNAHCDGGNTYGVIIPEDSLAAVAIINDAFLICVSAN